MTLQTQITIMKLTHLVCLCPVNLTDKLKNLTEIDVNGS